MLLDCFRHLAPVIYALFFLPSLLLSVPISPKPTWVKEINFLHDSVPSEEAKEEGFQGLLLDCQIHLEEKVFYWHTAQRVFNYSTIEQVSLLKIDWNPAFETVALHELKLHRDGLTIDLLPTVRYEILHREARLEKLFYNGKFTTVVFLNDIRIGDVVEIAFSKVGNPPFDPTYYMSKLLFQNYLTIDKLHYRLLSHPSRNLYIKPFYIAINPEITDLSPDLREWTWETLSNGACLTENEQPSWYDPCSRVQISLSKNWQDVIQKKLPLYVLSEEIKSSPSQEMLTLVTQWKNASPNPLDQATYALRFVQDEIRYFYFYEGIHAFTPTDPRVVLKQRFGDCKGKSFLLHTLLFFMDIQSTPVLVHTLNGYCLEDILPSPFVFDHVILKIDIEGKTYWVDPTMKFLGGPLQNTSSNYYWGLSLSQDTTELERIPEYVKEKPTEIDTTIVLESSEYANVRTKWTFYEDAADTIRWKIKAYGKKLETEYFLNKIQKNFPRATLSEPVSVCDDREKNTITYTTSFTIPKTVDVTSFIMSTYLTSAINSSRSSPLSLQYPLWVKEHIHIESPNENWLPSCDEVTYKFDTHTFLYNFKSTPNSADFDYELCHHKDHVSIPELQDYCENMKDIGHLNGINRTSKS